MGQRLNYYYESQWVAEGSSWRPCTHPPTPDVIILRDEAGVPISSASMTTMTLTLYDLTSPLKPVFPAVNQVDCKNTRGCTINTSGVFLFTLLPSDTIILEPAHDYELRCALIQYTWASGAKSDALEITFVVRNLYHRNEWAGEAAMLSDTVEIILV